MSQFVEKIGEKLHLGGQKKEGEQGHPPPHTSAGQPQGYGGGYTENPTHAHAAEQPPYTGGQGGYGQPTHGQQGHGGHGQPAPQHVGPLEKVKQKIKGKKDGGEGGSSSSSSESDGEGGRRKKKHGIF